MYKYFSDVRKEQLEKELVFVKQGVELNGQEYLQSIECGNMRVTWIDSKGNVTRFKGGRISKQAIVAAGGIGAAIDDGLLDISFRVLGFETLFVDNMGNVIPEVSNSAAFTPNQLARIRSLSRGKLFNISRIRVVGPDGIERTLTSPVEVIIN